MTPTETVTILRQFNEWRRGGDIEQPGPLAVGEAIDAAIEIIESAEEDRALCDKLAGILTRTANVLKGEPKPLHRHSWHDLPEVAQRLVAAAGQNTVNAMLAHSRKAGKQRARKPVAKHGGETFKP
ncbi:MAG: hypothetical protein PWP11_898 [Thauera sp.]|nr:hypothetical protein [Thauera sp.]MDI3489621.1 hypothetical protein [Thauera sp.]